MGVDWPFPNIPKFSVSKNVDSRYSHFYLDYIKGIAARENRAAGVRETSYKREKIFAPSNLFPNFPHRQQDQLADTVERTELEFAYIYGGENYTMAWKCGKSWNRSFMGRKGGEQPQRALYFRTLANLTNPSEVRGLLQLAHKPFQTEELTADLLIFAQRILPRCYRNLSVISMPGAPLALSVLTHRPLALAIHFQAGRVDDQVDGAASGRPGQPDRQVGLAPRAGGVVRHPETTKPHLRQHRTSKALGLAQGQIMQQSRSHHQKTRPVFRRH